MWTTVVSLVLTNKYVRALAIFVGGAAALGLAGLAFWTWLAFHDASVAREARQGYVTQVQLEAIQAKLDEAERQKAAVTTALTEYRQQAAEAIQARNQANAKLEEAIAADKSDGCTWTADDLDWLRKH